MLVIAGVFALGVVLDFLWGRYIVYAAARQANAAALVSGLITLLGSAAAIEYVKNPRLALPFAVGAMVGTHLAVRRSR